MNLEAKFSESSASTPTGESWTPRANTPVREISTSPLRASSQRPAPSTNTMANGNALSQLQPAQVRTLREGFEILDRDSDGVVNREDVADMLNQLGRDRRPSFRNGQKLTLNLP